MCVREYARMCVCGGGERDSVCVRERQTVRKKERVREKERESERGRKRK